MQINLSLQRCPQMINGDLKTFPLVNYILELHFLFLGTSHSHLLPCSTFAASGCRNRLGSKAIWRFEMILYWVVCLFFFNMEDIASREMCSSIIYLIVVRVISSFLYFIVANHECSMLPSQLHSPKNIGCYLF